MSDGATMVGRWGPFACWAPMPLVAGPTFAAALDPTDTGFRTATSIGLWLVWVAVLVATLVPRTVTLTLVRVAVPAAPVAVAWATFAGDAGAALEGVALALAGVATLVTLAPVVGWVFVNGSAYGAELRFPLRAPGLLLLGPIELAWALTVAGVCAGPLMLADGMVWAGLLLVAVGWPSAFVAGRSLHTLARRSAIFTQAGIVLVDPLALADTLLAQRQSLRAIGPAPSDTDALDLTVGALGLALELDFRQPQPVTPRPARRGAGLPPSVDATKVMFTPTRPGALLHEARSRRLPLG